jgi:hypothetical protein
MHRCAGRKWKDGDLAGRRWMWVTMQLSVIEDRECLFAK